VSTKITLLFQERRVLSYPAALDLDRAAELDIDGEDGPDDIWVRALNQDR
jgi:hypothetical protein